MRRPNSVVSASTCRTGSTSVATAYWSSAYADGSAPGASAAAACAQTDMIPQSRTALAGHPCRMPFVALNGFPQEPATRKWRCSRAYIDRSGIRMRAGSPSASTSCSRMICGSRSKHFDQSSDTPYRLSPERSASSILSERTQ